MMNDGKRETVKSPVRKYTYVASVSGKIVAGRAIGARGHLQTVSCQAWAGPGPWGHTQHLSVNTQLNYQQQSSAEYS